MGQVCQICNHPNRLEIDREIVQGISHTKIARKFNVGNQSVRNHAQNHLSRQLIKSQEMREAIQSQGLVQEIEELLAQCKAIMAEARQDGRLNLALNAIRETRGTLELMAKIAATMHQIRAQELQQEQLAADERGVIVEQEKLDRLTTEELMLLMMLQEKMQGLRDGGVMEAMAEYSGGYKHTIGPNPVIQADTDEVSGQGTQPPAPPVSRRRTRHPVPTVEKAKPEPVPYEERRVVPGSVRTSSPELSRQLGLDRLD